MSETFVTKNLLKSLSNYPVAKGDVAGHEFHGNQYTSGKGQDLSDKALKLLVAVEEKKQDPATSAAAHTELAIAHRALANKLHAVAVRADGQERYDLLDLANAHASASNAHEIAAMAHNVADAIGGAHGSSELARETSGAAWQNSSQANYMENKLANPEMFQT